MNPEQFTEVIRRYVADAAVSDTVKLLLAPSGRRPAASLVESSRWYNSLAPEDQEQVMRVAASAVHGAIFGFMCVLDGARILDEEHSEFHLFSVNPVDNTRTQLSGSEENDSLHELYKALDPD